MSVSVGDIVEINEFDQLLWEVVQGEFYEHNSIHSCVRVAYWGCPPDVQLQEWARDRLKNIELGRAYRVEIRNIRQPKNVMLVLAISAQDPSITGRGRMPWKESS